MYRLSLTTVQVPCTAKADIVHGVLITWVSLARLGSAAVAPATAPAIEPVRRAAALVSLVIIVSGILLISVALIMVGRRTRRRQSKRVANTGQIMPDPWSEAARRVQPFEADDEQGTR